MKTVTLKIAFDQHKVGEVIQFEDRIAKHFLAKGWAVEIEKAKKVKK